MPLPKASLERLIGASPDIVVATDSSGNVAFYSDGASEILGYAKHELIGEYVATLYPSLDVAKGIMSAMRDEARDGKGRIVNFETRVVAKDGREIPCALSGVILYDADGSEEGTIGFLKDLSEIKRKDQLAVLGEIAIGLSHEINNPLEAIANQLALLERFVAGLPEDADRAVQLGRVLDIRTEIRRIETRMRRVAQMSDSEEYQSVDYIGGARMIDLSGRVDEKRGPLFAQHVLVVDDDRAVRESVADLLRSEGCRVDTAQNGRVALARIEAEPFDLVLSDVVMPEMDGYELYVECGRRAPDTVVALMTAFYYDKDHVIKRSRMEGLDGVLFKKPIDPERLRKVLGDLVRARPQRAPSTR